MAPSPPSLVRLKAVQRRTLASASVSHLPMPDDQETIHKASSLLVHLLPREERLARLAREKSPNHQRERKLFADAIRDGYLLCLLLNVLRPGSRIPNRDPLQNISCFLATCTSLGVPKHMLFSQDHFHSLALVTIASSLLNIVDFLRSQSPSNPTMSRISSRAAASTPNLLRDRPLPSTPSPPPRNYSRLTRQPNGVAQVLGLDDDDHDYDLDENDEYYDQLDQLDEDGDESDTDNLLSTQSTPLNFLSRFTHSPSSLLPKNLKPPPKSPLRKSLASPSHIPSTKSPPPNPNPKPLPFSPSSSTSSPGRFSLFRPVSNLRALTGAGSGVIGSGGGGSNVNLPGLVSGLGSKVTLRKSPPTKTQASPSPPKTKTGSQTQTQASTSRSKTPTRIIPSTPTKTKGRTQSPLPTSSPSSPSPLSSRTTRAQSPLPSSPSRLALVQDPRRPRSPPPTPRSPTSPSPSTSRSPSLARTPSSPRSPTRLRPPTSTSTTSLLPSTPSSAISSRKTSGGGGDRDSNSPTRLRSRETPNSNGMNHQAQAHHRHHQPSNPPHQQSHHQHPNHTLNAPHQTPQGLSHTKSVQSIQSMTSLSVLSEGTTATSIKSSLFDVAGARGSGYAPGMNRRASGGLNNGNYATIRTVTTELTEPSIWDEDLLEVGGDDGRKAEEFEEVMGMDGVDVDVEETGDCWVEEMQVKVKLRESFKFPVVAVGNGKKQDLSRVNEVEEDESTSGCERRGRERDREREKERERQKSPVNLHLGKGKFPDDFMDVFGRVAAVRRSVERDREKNSVERKEEKQTHSSQQVLPTTPVAPDREKDGPRKTSPIPVPALQPTARTRTLTPIARSPPRSPAPIARSPPRSPALCSSPKAIAPSPSPPRKLAIVGFSGGDSAAGTGTRGGGTSKTMSTAAPRRPTHWSRRSVDIPRASDSSSSSTSVLGEAGNRSSSPGTGLLPRPKLKEGSGAEVRVPRRHSTSATRKPPLGGGPASASASGSGSGKNREEGNGGSLESASGNGEGEAAGTKGSVPFPRTVSAEYYSHSQEANGAERGVGGRGLSPPPLHRVGIPIVGRARSPSPRSSDPLSASPLGGVGGGLMAERTRMVRDRYQSNIEGSSGVGRRRRPSSYDEVGLSAIGITGGGRPRLRSRFESMVNLSGTGGGTLSNASASASDLLAARESVVSSEGGLSVLSASAGSRKLVVREDGKPPTRYQLGNCIGRGQFGSVYRALNENTGQMVAVKRIRLEGLKEEEVTQLMKEVDLVKSLSHPSVVKYEGMVREDGMLNIVLEYAENGSLGQTLKSFGKLNEALVARYVVKILEGLHYLHMSNIVHCDLKAANILTTKNGNVKLTDFGVSLNLRAMEKERGGVDEPVQGRTGRVQQGGGGSGERHGNVAGTPNWMAPEVIELKGASTKSDIWSLGCTVVELLTGRPPYADVGNAMSVMFRIVEDPMPPLPEKCDALLEDFLRRCFDKNPALRPSAEELCEHPWLKKNWSAFKDLKAQDSIPWIRRVSADFQSPSDAIRYLSQLEIPESPLSASPMEHHHHLGLAGRRTPASSGVGRPPDSPRDHSFVKTTFSKPMTCRVCLFDVKKTALICGQCSLISHSKCAPGAPATCDLRAQLLQYAEKGNPAIAYSHPAVVNNLRNNTKQNVALSDVAFVEHSRASLDGSPQPPQSPLSPVVVEHSPTAFKFMAAFKRSRSNLMPEPAASPLMNNDEDGHAHGHGGGSNNTKAPAMQRLIKRSFGALHSSSPYPLPPPPPPAPPALPPAPPTESVTSCSSSLKSAATANESFSSRQNTGHRSQVSSPVSGGSGSGSGGRSASASGSPGGGGFLVGYYDVQRRKSNSTVAVLETVPGSRPTTSGARSEFDQEEGEGDEEYEGESVVDVEETRVPGGLGLGFEPKKRKRGGSSSNCMVQ